MSTPVGQSRAQPLQDRQRSSASSTAGSVTAQVPGDDVLQHPRAAAGGVLLLAGGHVGRAHHSPARRCCRRRTCRRRCSGAPRRTRSRERPGVGADARPQRRPSSGSGSTSTPGLSRLPGSSIALDPPHQRHRLGGVHPAAAAPSARGRHRARRSSSRRTTRPGRRRPRRTRRNLPAAIGVVELEVDAHVHAAVAEVAVGDTVETRTHAAARRSRAGRRRAGPAAPRRPPTRSGRAVPATGPRGRRRPPGSATAPAARRRR